MENKRKELTDADRKICRIIYAACRKYCIKQCIMPFIMIVLMSISYYKAMQGICQNNIDTSNTIIFVTLPFFIAFIIDLLLIYTYYRRIYIVKRLMNAEEYEIYEFDSRYYVHISGTEVYINDTGKLQGIPEGNKSTKE